MTFTISCTFPFCLFYYLCYICCIRSTGVWEILLPFSLAFNHSVSFTVFVYCATTDTLVLIFLFCCYNFYICVTDFSAGQRLFSIAVYGRQMKNLLKSWILCVNPLMNWSQEILHYPRKLSLKEKTRILLKQILFTNKKIPSLNICMSVYVCHVVIFS